MFVRSKILLSPHAFATRRGGISSLEHTSSLNLAFGRGDDNETVLKNLEIFADEVGFDAKNTVSLPQIHSDTVFKVGKEDRGKGYYICEEIESGDGYITGESGVVLGIKTADCVPILFEAEKSGEIVAVGAVHAGWRGTVLGIASKCVKMICDDFGVSAEGVRAAIGPCIHKCCYEVGDDFLLAVSERRGEDFANRYIYPSKENQGKYFCDLVGMNRELLVGAGVPLKNIDVIDECTCCNPEKYFSHRYSKGLRGTMLSVVFMQN